MMRPRVVSIIGSTAFAGHESWLMERMEVDLGLDETEAKYYARFVLSSLIQPDEIDPHREKELFVYNKPSPNSSGYDDLGGLYMDTRSPEEISISELQQASCAPMEHVTKLILKLGRRLELSKRKRHNSETSEGSGISSQSSSSSYEAEFPQLPSRQANEPDIPLTKITSWIRRQDKQFRFAFKNPSKVRCTSTASSSLPSLPTRRSQKSPTKCSPQKIPKDPELKKSQKGKSARDTSLNKEKRKRKRNRKKKKKTNAESTTEYKNLATYENFDHFSMDQALNFVQSLSGQKDDSNIWTNVVKDQHVKYLNGTFYFTPREQSSSSSSKSESAKSYKTKFFLEQDDSSPTGADDIPLSPTETKIDKTIRKPVKCDDGLSHAARIANRMAEIIIDEPDDIFWSDRQPIESMDSTTGDVTWPVLSDTLISPPFTKCDSWTIW